MRMAGAQVVRVGYGSWGAPVGSAVVAGPGMASAGVVGAVFSLVACALTLLTMRIDRQRG